MYLISTPLKPCQKYNHSTNAQQATDEVNTPNYVTFIEIFGVNSWRRVIEADCNQKAQKTPKTAEQSDISPARVVCDELTPEYRWGKWEDGKNQNGHIPRKCVKHVIDRKLK